MELEATDVPHFDIEIEPDKVEVEFYQILEKIKPLWQKTDYVFERSPLLVSRGLLNTMVKCYSKTDEMDAIMIRIPNIKVNQWIDRSLEVKCLKLLKPHDCAPNIIATFNNGFCYEYIHGEILTHTSLREEPIWRLIASDLAKFHSIDLNDESKEKSKEKFMEILDKLWIAYPDELKDPKKNEIFKREIPPKDELKAEIDLLMKQCENVCSELVLCHNDTRGENIIWNEEKQRIHFVDFEGMGYGYQANEIASHFSRFCGFAPPDYSLMPSEEFQMNWLRCYLEKYYEFTDKNPADITEKDVRILYVQVRKFHQLLMFSGCVAGPVFEATDLVPEGQIDMLAYAIITFKEYHKVKDEISALKLPD